VDGHNLYTGNDWQTSTFYTGLTALYRITGDPSIKTSIINWCQVNNWQPNMSSPTNPDNMCCMQTYCESYILDPLPSNTYMYQPTKSILDNAIAQNQSGSSWFWWEDGLYMGLPIFSMLGSITGDTKYYTSVTNIFLDCANAYYDQTYHLWYWKKDWVYPLKKTKNGNPEFWGCGNGWVAGCMTRVMKYMPDSFTGKSEWIRLFTEQCEALRAKQLPNGMWTSGLYDPYEYPDQESTSTAFFIYAMANGVMNGTLPRSVYDPVIRNAWNGLVACVHPSGQFGWGQPPSNQPGTSSYNTTVAKGHGAFLLASEAMYRYMGY
jgi:unsaturated rhamnogalacturonyl hydrolase